MVSDFERRLAATSLIRKMLAVADDPRSDPNTAKIARRKADKLCVDFGIDQTLIKPHDPSRPLSPVEHLRANRSFFDKVGTAVAKRYGEDNTDYTIKVKFCKTCGKPEDMCAALGICATLDTEDWDY